MSTEPKSPLETYDSIDKRVPPEIWERIFNCLYPSQLSRMSIVNKNLNTIVSSLQVWSKMFYITFGPKKRLRTLRNMPESKSYMLYMCASSDHVCEECLDLAPVRAAHSGQLPCRVLAPLPTMSKSNVKYLGEKVNLRWTVLMCRSCSEKQVSTIEVGNDKKTRNRILWYRQQD